MSEIKHIVSKSGVLATASAIHKALKLIADGKTKAGGKSDSKASHEIELLKDLCKSDNPQTVQVAVQALVHLVNVGSLDLGQTLGILVAALANNSPAHVSAVGNGMFDLLLLDLRRRCSALGDKTYICQFDLKPPQHPLILLLGSKDIVSMLSFGNKIHDVCQHHDQLIRKNSIEFLRPVFLYIFNNQTLFPETQKMWRTLLVSSVNDNAAVSLIYDILAWSKTSTREKCLFTNNLLIEALEFYSSEDAKFIWLRLDLCMYLAAVSKAYIGFNYDPSENFLKISATLQAVREETTLLNYNSVLLMILADLLQYLAPTYITGLMRIVRYLLKYGCNRLSRLMILDGAVQLLGQQTFVQNYLEDCNYIMQAILKSSRNDDVRGIISAQSAAFFHCDTAKYYHICNWWNSVELGHLSVNNFIESISRNDGFCAKVHLVLRGLFYMKELSFEDWQKIFDKVILCARSNEEISSVIITPMLFALANEIHPRKRIYLLRSLASMGARDHVLSVLKALTKDVDKSISLDLYLRLWKAEPRTYPFLYDMLKDTSYRPKEDHWETTLARTFTIREVCMIRPHQHGADLVNLFSEILSRPEDAANEAAVALAIDAIACLCENHVVNIVSTWKVLGFKFTNEERPRIIRSLCKFFANVPSIKINSLDQERLVNEIIMKLWHFITDFNEREIIVVALESLKSFPPEMMNIFHIPEIFRQGIPLPHEENDSLDAKKIPGECWIQLIYFVNHLAIEEAGDLVAHHINNEMLTYRGGVYVLPEGRAEPSSLRSLPKDSILAAVIHHLINHAGKRNSNTNDIVLYNLLRVVAKQYPKPIPPLDWCFLHEYFHHSYEAKQYCLQIAIKQMPFSGTAKRIVENYLSEAVEIDMKVEDILVVLEHLDIVTDSVQSDVYKRYVHLALQLLLECSEDLKTNEGDPFLVAIEYLKLALLKKSYHNEENFEYLCVTLENLFSRFKIHSKIFDEYVKVLSVLPTRHLVSLLKPSTWIDKENLTKLEKAIFLQFSLHKLNPAATELHLLGLSDILNTISPVGDEPRNFFLFSFCEFVTSLGSHKALIGWIIELIGYIQSNLANVQSHSMKKVILLLDVFFISVISISGFGALLGNKTIVGSLDMRLSIFPPSLIMVFQLNLWREIENKIYEFLYHLYNQPSLPEPYAKCFRNALLCCKEQSFFQQSKAWPKFVSLRRL